MHNLYFIFHKMIFFFVLIVSFSLQIMFFIRHVLNLKYEPGHLKVKHILWISRIAQYRSRLPSVIQSFHKKQHLYFGFSFSSILGELYCCACCLCSTTCILCCHCVFLGEQFLMFWRIWAPSNNDDEVLCLFRTPGTIYPVIHDRPL